MHSLKFFVSVGAVLILIFSTDNKVMAAPTPHPCLWLMDLDHNHPVTTTTTTTTEKPKDIEELAKLQKASQFEKITDWIIWGPNTEVPRSHPKNPVEKMISAYIKFLARIMNNMF